MTQQEKTALQLARLTQEGEQTFLRLVRLREIFKSEVDPTVDEGDPSLEERERIMVLIQLLERRLQLINEALQQLTQGSYGLCESCGQPIDPARLEAVPETTYCLQCKTIAERQPRSMAIVDWPKLNIEY